ncbi:hypothetical protein Kpol_480p22 [Vanderwaltozyma polyspora DSM 70294]|uniref:RING-type domain-containing protein n=1 Tax=Vanderwaltozyma polyspora (strain ATCC 22028 / DSM 70294 / BCRC 21397 / CBS 2163 / NBRC 10782 / NRRL Y-8283 / UCD 57-17) TaxID=436907 RepID=A7TP84_VANPO|nr:uncharacterized protein Kpol_480p22 [Vanderwaltozyma polyspora DSM 70294]EDO15935.1 hypothetical protein Kpol_480p22 [Vanderwaltozyma polyspora DSM 70294]
MITIDKMNGLLHVSVLSQSKKTKNKLLGKVLDSTLCSICHDYMYVPMMVACGHNYCYSCLSSWFTSNETQELSCPQCRANVTTAPALNTTLQQLLETLAEVSLDDTKKEKEGEDVNKDGSENNDDDEKSKIDMNTFYSSMEESKNEYNMDKRNENLFGKVFINSAMAVIDEDDDGIARCSNCHWELDPDFDETDGNVCPHCSTRIRNRVPESGYSRTTSDAIGGGQRRGGFDSDEYSEGELEELEQDLQRYHEASEQSIRELDTDNEGEEGSGGMSAEFDRRFPIPRQGRNFLHDDEAEESSNNGDDDDDDDDGDEAIRQRRRHIDMNQEVESDLDSFIADDDDEEQELDVEELDGLSDNDSKRNRMVLQESESERDSDYYEHNDDGYVSGDSLVDDQPDQEPQQQNKRQRRYKVILQGSDEDED